MSGIAGYWGYSAKDLAQTNFAAFTHSLAHRGPDGFGIEHFREARLWLGHRRLAVLDPSERARQPMAYGGGRYWLTYNGEIYNYVALREELRGLGHCFVSNTDSEVILAAYAQWGRDCLFRFNGMWAFAIWDASERQLFLSRDRFGIKPLHYSLRAGAVVFASELKAFLTLPWIDGAFDPEILAETLTDIVGQEASPDTLLPGVHRLLAGQNMLIKADGNVRIETWWNTFDHLPRPAVGLHEQAEEFRALFLDACRLRLCSDVPLATEQSGGLDSSAIACTVAELGRIDAIARAPKDWQRAFIACFTGTSYDESRYARMVVDHTGMAPHYESIGDRQALDNIEKVIFDHEIIFTFPRVGPWLLYRAMRNAGIHVSLNGLGVDDLLAGDPDDVEAALDAAAVRWDLHRYRDLRRVLRGLAGGNLRIDRASTLGEIRWFAQRELARLRLLEPLRVVRARCHALPVQLRLLMASGDFAVLRATEPLLRPYAGRLRIKVGTVDMRTAGMTRLQAKHFTKFHIGNATYLANFDRSSMAHGIEVRMPFMDWRLVTFGFALPDTSRNGGGYTKRVLRLAMEGLMPDSIRLRTSKVAFMSPLDEWARGALKPWLLDVCASRSFLESAVWNGPAVRALVERAVVGQASLRPVWPMLQAHALERAFVARAAAKAGDEPRPPQRHLADKVGQSEAGAHDPLP
jgi:asparagine synthase (glutamine-hydrolysing)